MTHTIQFMEQVRKGTEAEEYIIDFWRKGGWNVFDISSYHIPLDLSIQCDYCKGEIC